MTDTIDPMSTRCDFDWVLAMSGWGCPNEFKGTCLRVAGRSCDPGMKGCVLRGRFVFSNPEKNPPPVRTRRQTGAPPPSRAGTAPDD